METRREFLFGRVRATDAVRFLFFRNILRFAYPGLFTATKIARKGPGGSL